MATCRSTSPARGSPSSHRSTLRLGGTMISILQILIACYRAMIGRGAVCRSAGPNYCMLSDTLMWFSMQVFLFQRKMKQNLHLMSSPKKIFKKTTNVTATLTLALSMKCSQALPVKFWSHLSLTPLTNKCF